MTARISTVSQAAEEAEFQLLAAKDQLNWFAALASAIAIDHCHGGSKHVQALGELASYLADSGFSSVDIAIDDFRRLKVAQSEPQIVDRMERGTTRGAK